MNSEEDRSKITDLKEWENQDLWSQDELQCLCCGINPKGPKDDQRALNDALEKIKRAVLVEKLPVHEPTDAQQSDRWYGHHRFFEPADAIPWAKARFTNFPNFNQPSIKSVSLSKSPKPVSLSKKPLDPREKSTLLNIIAVLMRCVLDKNVNSSGNMNQKALIHHIVENYPKTPGLKERTLEDKFAAAKKSLEEHSQPQQ